MSRFTISRFVVLLTLVGLCSCSETTDFLHVDKFTLRSPRLADVDTPMIRGEQRKRLYGAVSMQEQFDRMGQYYTLRWNLRGTALGRAKSAVLTFHCQRSATGSKVLTKRFLLREGAVHGNEEIQIIGKNYRQNGRVLAWEAVLSNDGEVVETKRSYLWAQRAF